MSELHHSGEPIANSSQTSSSSGNPYHAIASCSISRRSSRLRRATSSRRASRSFHRALYSLSRIVTSSRGSVPSLVLTCLLLSTGCANQKTFRVWCELLCTTRAFSRPSETARNKQVIGVNYLPLCGGFCNHKRVAGVDYLPLCGGFPIIHNRSLGTKKSTQTGCPSAFIPFFCHHDGATYCLWLCCGYCKAFGSWLYPLHRLYSTR